MQTTILKTFDKATGRTKPSWEKVMALFRAIGEDDLQAVQKFVGRYGIDQTTDDIDQRSALMTAARDGKADIIRYLLAQGSPVDAFAKDGDTAFTRAIEGNHVDCARILMEAGANIDPHGRYGWRLLHSTVGFDRYDSFLFLLKQGVEVDSRNENGVTPLMHAVRSHREGRLYVEKLLAAGANMDLRDNDGRSAYDDACRRGLADVVKLIQKQRAENMNATVKKSVPILKPLRINRNHQNKKAAL